MPRCTCAWRLLFRVNHPSRSHCAIRAVHENRRINHRVHHIQGHRSHVKEAHETAVTEQRRDETKRISPDYVLHSHADATRSSSCRYSTSHSRRSDSLILSYTLRNELRDGEHTWNCKTLKFFFISCLLFYLFFILLLHCEKKCWIRKIFQLYAAIAGRQVNIC